MTNTHTHNIPDARNNILDTARCKTCSRIIWLVDAKEKDGKLVGGSWVHAQIYNDFHIAVPLRTDATGTNSARTAITKTYPLTQ